MKTLRLKKLRLSLGPLVVGFIFTGALILRYNSTQKSETSLPSLLPPLAFKLIEASKETGVSNLHQGYQVHPSLSNVQPYLSAVGASVAVVDFDNDGWPDVYLNNSAPGSKNRLFRNNHDGTFTDVAEAAHIANLNDPNPSTRALFFDVNNDGFKDLFLLSHCPRLFLNQRDGTFKETTGQSQFGCGYTYGGVNVIDYDEDGFLDLIVAPYLQTDYIHHPKNTRVMPNNFHSATNGGRLTVFHNDGHGHFSPVAGNLGMNRPGWTHAIGIYDTRGTGRPDIWLPTDYNTLRLYLNEGKGEFKELEDQEIAPYYSRNGMGADFADLDEDGHPLAYISNIYTRAQYVSGNTLFKWNERAKTFNEMGRDRGVNQCGWSWAAKFIDFDNSGTHSLLVGNGFISASKNTDYWYQMNTLDSSDRSVLEDVRNWPPMQKHSLSGYQKPCFYTRLSQNSKVFTDIVDSTPLGKDVSDKRGIAVIDYLNNGSPSLVIANQKQPSAFYKNEQLNTNQWIGFKLIGTQSNRDAFGTQVTLQLTQRTLTQQLQPLNGYASQSDDRIRFGLGSNPMLKKVKILWPNHVEQVLEGSSLKLNQYQTLTEPTR